MDDSDGKANELLAKLRRGDESAAEAIFDRYARRLIGLARSQLDTRVRQKIDPEDVVQSVFRSFFGRQQENFTVRDENHLWYLLALITARKCTNLKVYFGREVRNAAREVRFDVNPQDSAPHWEALAESPNPADAAVLTDLVERLLSDSPDKERRIVALALEGKTAREISDQVNRAERTVRRIVQYFRERLEAAVLDPSSVLPDGV